MKNITFVFFIFSFFHSTAQEYGTFKDTRNRITYKTVKFFDQIWMAENLNVDKFQNGDKIRKVSSKEEWITACLSNEPVWMYFENNADNGTKFGKIYNYYAIIDKRNLAPLNYRIPSASDFLDFSNLLVVDLKSQTGWYKSSFTKKVLVNVNKIDRNGFPYLDVDFVEREFTIGGSGNNNSGFNAFPCGRIDIYGKSEFLGQESCFWSLTKGDIANSQSVFRLSWDDQKMQIINSSFTQGFYLRCVSGKNQEEIKFENAQKIKRDKFIQDSLKKIEANIQKDLKFKDDLQRKYIRDSIIKTLVIGSEFEDGIVINFQNNNSQAILLSKDEFYIKRRDLIEAMKELKKDGLDWNKWQIPTYGNMVYVAKLLKTNKKAKKIFFETKLVDKEVNNSNFYWSETYYLQLFGSGTFNLLISNDMPLGAVSYTQNAFLRYIRIANLN